ncbi:glutamate synthase large subunit [Salsipaludibacter albus]|uniref:glutamate synthase large subunit n=1 Tax=Salsipaludibacter albus TaxID=2849650 RepID=UPI001EE4B0BC|nr:glutamate synthase large subunit [Salsipaludibacter albus]
MPGDGRPVADGLYDPRNEHDACGVSFVVDMHGRATHEMVQRGLSALCSLDHRGATGAEANVGDGAGILVQVPDDFLRDEFGGNLPPFGSYAVGLAFLPREHVPDAIKAVDEIIEEEGLRTVAWRDVPVDNSAIGSMARDIEPAFRHLVVTGPGLSGMDLERRAFVLRKRIEHEVSIDTPDGPQGVYFPSLSTRTLVYKGMLTSEQLGDFFLDLQDRRLTSAMALVHSRFSTNTFPSWPLAHPYRMLAHNGEINTVMGNRNWMHAREGSLDSSLFGTGALDRAFPIMTPDASDTASFDEALELLHLGGRSLPHAVLMMIPEAWEAHQTMPTWKRDFYEYHAGMMEPWDGPAAIAFTDGTVIGAVLDRNGLRPSRYWVTDDGMVVMASEVGVVDVDPATVVRKGRLQPGRMFLVDTAQGRIVEDEEVKRDLAEAEPYGQWLSDGLLHLEDLPERTLLTPQHASVVGFQRTFGYTTEEIKVLLAPMARTGAEPIGSMGTDTPVAVLSDRPRLLFDYVKQLFAQVTNPPLDAIREELVTSMAGTIGPESNLLAAGPEHCRQIVLPRPILTNQELAKILYMNEDGEYPEFDSFAVDGLYPVDEGGDGMARALEDIFERVSAAIDEGAKIIVLSDRYSNAELAPIPSLLLTSAVHQHLIRTQQRTKVGLVIETGEAREVHHMAALLGYGAAAINPYLAFETFHVLVEQGVLADLTPEEANHNYVKGCTKGVLKIMSKMGISTVASYTGAQIFEAVGLSRDLVDAHFTGTTTQIEGIGLDEIAAEVAQRHAFAHLERPTEVAHRDLWVGGEYQWRREGEYHLFNPQTVFKLQHATRQGRYDVFKEYTSLVDDQSERLATLRGLLDFKEGEREPIPIDEVEPVSEIVKRFSTGAMSYGSISAEAHETLAIAMNRLGAKSNTGEGGEDSRRFTPDDNGDLRRSAIKQVASGRFGVTSEYLVNADDLQIKMAQGAKPGEGGQLPGKKVWPWIAQTRHSTPGVGLISPPPHHDIYSIEDIKQLIHDLKNANPNARVHVKLVAQRGVGTVAAGVSKAKSDVVLISGHDGGTGASPLNSIKHAGGPWELGLAETQQTLLRNGLRDRIVVQVDGQLKTGRDVMIAALLGAEEFGFATAPLVVSGCIMMRVCHLDTCPVGVATQNPELRQRFNGKAEYVVNFMTYIAEEVRELMARLGFRTLQEAIGHVESLDATAAIDHWKADGLDLAPILSVPTSPWEQDRFCSKEQDHGLDRALDQELVRRAAPAIEHGARVTMELPIANRNRTVGTLLGHHVTTATRGLGLPDDTIDVTFTGSAGQSFGAFLPKGITLRLEGDANDYIGKGLSGGRLVIRPARELHPDFKAEESIIAGNVIAYGATGGEIYLRGEVGERFCVRNSGATVVAEGVGDHACEYMTGGRAVILGPTGRNVGAGMSGGIAYVYDPRGVLFREVNQEMVNLEAPEPEDLAWLREVVATHADETGSPLATSLLARWHAVKRHFRKVMPTDYKRVLEAAREAEEEGRDVEEAIMASARGGK